MENNGSKLGIASKPKQTEVQHWKTLLYRKCMHVAQDEIKHYYPEYTNSQRRLIIRKRGLELYKFCKDPEPFLLAFGKEI
jgi:hypothetical protein